MRTFVTIATVSLMILAGFLVASCTKEKTVESTEYVHDIKYVDSPPDTVFFFDTVYRTDSVKVDGKDTVRIIDTIKVTTTIHDTVRVNSVIHDTVTTVKTHYDTLVVRDTVIKTVYAPSSALAVTAMEIQTDPLVLTDISSQGEATDGWVFYLTPEQMSITQVSTGVYDIDAYLIYYTSDFSSEYAYEVYWRMSYKSGDPAISTNWTMADPPTAAPGKSPGIRTASKSAMARLNFQSLMR
jgi:hypothetical protein